MTKAPLMPVATAVWLLENTSLTFKQIAEFCKMHEVEIQSIADGEVEADGKLIYTGRDLRVGLFQLGQTTSRMNS